MALANVLTRTATTDSVAIIIVGTLLTFKGQATVGEMVTFMNFSGLIIARLERSVSFVNSVVSEAPRLREFFKFGTPSHRSRDRRGAIDPGRLQGRVEFKHVSFRMTVSAWLVEDLFFSHARRNDRASSVQRAPENRPPSLCSTALSIRSPVRSTLTARHPQI